MLMEQQLKNALETPRQDAKGARRCRMNRDSVVLYGMWRGWSDTALAQMLGVTSRSVYRDRQRFLNNLSLMFLCPVLRVSVKAGRKVWVCRFCGQEMVEVERKAR